MFTLKSTKYSFLFLLTLLTGFSGFSQKSETNSVKKKVSDNAKLFQVSIDKAFLQIAPLLKSAVTVKDSVSELNLLDRKCRYFYSKNQIDSLLRSSEKLQQKAKEYDDLYSESMGYVYTAEAYSINQFYDKALDNLDRAYKILEKDNSKNPKIFFAKANILNSYANVYTDRGEPKKAVKKLYQAINSYSELKDPKQIRSFQYLNYSNIASLYLLYNIDSAAYFAKKSMDLESPAYRDDKVMISNYSVLGKAYKQKKDYKKSLYYYQKSMELSDKTGEKLNNTSIYNEMVELYDLTGRKDSAILYENKLKQNEISELQSKYNSLHEVIDKDHKEEKKTISINNSDLIVILIGSVAVLAVVITLLLKKKKKRLVEPHEAYATLINLLKAQDSSFIFAFENTYPDFANKLLKINPQLTSSEIEFCAFLKLKLSTKEIAEITFIESRTVQNKKHRIRKRLNIPSSSDIYYWFDSI